MVTHAELVSAFGSLWVATMPPEVAERHFLIATGMGGLACMSRADNRIYWYEPGSSDRKFALANTSLERFVEIAYQLRLKFKGLDLFYSARRGRIGGRDRRRGTPPGREIRDVDPPSFDSPAMFWQHVVLLALETLASEE
ncbi:SUKH-4 family immunity protein [Streptomyces sp. FXJ1.4098]|nr:SUKH-4 family immunity protein [Streptomyces sp. FXJ1.4098]